MIADKIAKGPRGRRFGDPGRPLGEHPDKGGPVTVKAGRYGPYVSHDGINATLPRDKSPEAITLEEALALLEARAQSAGDTRRAGRGKQAKDGKRAKPASKLAAKPAAKPATKPAAKPATKPATKQTDNAPLEPAPPSDSARPSDSATARPGRIFGTGAKPAKPEKPVTGAKTARPPRPTDPAAAAKKPAKSPPSGQKRSKGAAERRGGNSHGRPGR